MADWELATAGDMKPYLDRGVFRGLRDVNCFARVGIVLGAGTWPDDQDIAPETLLEEMVLVEPTGIPTAKEIQSTDQRL
jgi:hypothetical protein